MPDLTEAAKKILKEKNKIIKLELEFEREMNKDKAPNPFDLKAEKKEKESGTNTYAKDNQKTIKKLKA